ncbi:hypothetical protein K469DRAFT_747334 [Zopfia rhizophila CBS 207.26]|uniref:Uncharacterized protein n=1 Tax=Zopfia rhizophila CBS 207.26 TaxID=1314779 RepID=A0A6A6EGW9_9PEZI|nr:hypothetical protein K469DRAFT_747334 [Zopfia rhizophila CBS 207.26]
MALILPFPLYLPPTASVAITIIVTRKSAAMILMMERERPSTRQRYGPSRPHGEVVEADRDPPQPAAPASAGHIHDIFAEYEKTFGEGSMKQKSRERKQWCQPPSRPTNPIRDGSLSLASPSGELVLDERRINDPDHITS